MTCQISNCKEEATHKVDDNGVDVYMCDKHYKLHLAWLEGYKEIGRRFLFEMTETNVSEERVVEALVLRAIVKKFIEDNNINCAEAVWQTDCVSENSLEFIESLCDVVGYCDIN